MEQYVEEEAKRSSIVMRLELLLNFINQIRLIELFVNFSLHGIPVRGEDGAKLILSMGFIDTLTYFNYARRAESKLKNIVRNATIQHPDVYGDRIKSFFRDIFWKEEVIIIHRLFSRTIVPVLTLFC